MTRPRRNYGQDLSYYSGEHVIVTSRNGRCIDYQDFKAIYDMCDALVEIRLAEKDAVDILIEFRIIVPDNI